MELGWCKVVRNYRVDSFNDGSNQPRDLFSPPVGAEVLSSALSNTLRTLADTLVPPQIATRISPQKRGAGSLELFFFLPVEGLGQDNMKRKRVHRTDTTGADFRQRLLTVATALRCVANRKNKMT